MIDLMSFFGYVKVPKAAVRLSILNEVGIEKMIRDYPDDYRKYKKWQREMKYHEILKQLQENTKAITGFLRSGRLLE